MTTRFFSHETHEGFGAAEAHESHLNASKRRFIIQIRKT